NSSEIKGGDDHKLQSGGVFYFEDIDNKIINGDNLHKSKAKEWLNELLKDILENKEIQAQQKKPLGRPPEIEYYINYLSIYQKHKDSDKLKDLYNILIKTKDTNSKNQINLDIHQIYLRSYISILDKLLSSLFNFITKI